MKLGNVGCVERSDDAPILCKEQIVLACDGASALRWTHPTPPGERPGQPATRRMKLGNVGCVERRAMTHRSFAKSKSSLHADGASALRWTHPTPPGERPGQPATRRMMLGNVGCVERAMTHRSFAKSKSSLHAMVRLRLRWTHPTPPGERPGQPATRRMMLSAGRTALPSGPIAAWSRHGRRRIARYSCCCAGRGSTRTSGPRTA